MTRIPVSCIARVAGLVLAVFLSRPAGAFTSGSATLSDDSLSYGTGFMLNTGYFFKDTMFYSRGRGGIHFDGGQAFHLGGKFGAWIGGGVTRPAGTLRSFDQDGSRFDTHFDGQVIHADLGVLTPWTPFPLGIMFYRHTTDLEERALDGPLGGRIFSGRSTGFGWGFTIHLLFEWFPWDPGSVSRRGPGFVLGYMGLVDMKKTDIKVRDSGGLEMFHRGWKPAAGESLRAGIEWEY